MNYRKKTIKLTGESKEREDELKDFRTKMAHNNTSGVAFYYRGHNQSKMSEPESFADIHMVVNKFTF